MDHPRPELPTREEFAAAVNTSFEIQPGDGEPVGLTLTECNSIISSERQECYSLLFRGPADQPPVQETHSLQNDQLGRFELLLVPVKRDDSGVYFEAVINRLVGDR